jgi:altronate hydrolase
MNDYLIINEKLDNVGVALKNLTKGSLYQGIVLLDDIPFGHKFALRIINEGENIIKYGSPLGRATVTIHPGAWVHTNNVHTNLDTTVNYTYNKSNNQLDPEDSKIKVKVYPRVNNRYGIRNEIWIIPTVGCINQVCRNYASLFEHQVPISQNYDGIKVLEHPYGCSQMGDDLVNTTKTLQALASNPNAGGVLIVGLGCENNKLSTMLNFDYDKNRLQYINLQDFDCENIVFMELLHKLHRNLLNDQRVEKDLSCLTIGMKCGGSDGLSGITANPLIGKIADTVVRNEGTVILTEIPEMFGAEEQLMNRCANIEVFNKFVKLISEFKDYYTSHNQIVYDNPSPGNKQGGITTLEEKSLGCVQKGGVSVISNVNFDHQPLTTNGLNIIKSPGNDLVSCTELCAAGASLILFSTGRGTPFGSVVPTIKISTNSKLATFKSNWIDFDAGVLIGGETMDNLANQLLKYIVNVINGQKTINEVQKIGSIAIFKDGVTL